MSLSLVVNIELESGYHLTMTAVKIGDLVVIKGEPKTGVVLSVSTQVPYEGCYARVIFEEEVRVINTALLARVE